MYVYISVCVYIYIYIYIYMYIIVLAYCMVVVRIEVPPVPPQTFVWRGKTVVLRVCHRLPDRVRTSGFFAEVPQYTIIMT